MNYTLLGSSSLRISEIGFGCMSLGGSETESTRILHEALAKGINFFDTADLYNKGANEELVGRAFKDRRDQVVLATKVGNQWRPDGSGWDWNPRKDYILSSVEGSLKRLGIDHIDLYQLHGGTIEDPIDEAIEAFELLKQQGKIRYYGISSIRPNVIREWVRRSNIVSVMMQYSLLDRRPEEQCLDLLLQHHIGVLARGSVAQGLLINKPPKSYLAYGEGEVKKAAEAVQAVSGQQRSATQTALRYVMQHPAVTSAVVGIRTMEQLEEALLTPGTPLLSETELEGLRKSIAVNTYEQHR
jgi:aryl-alcohol dehydrogenase-like predicted oxidoreductase